MRIYYAHCMSIYNTPAEARDLEMLHKLFPNDQIINPNTESVRKDIETIDHDHVMDYFTNLVTCCDVVAFRAMPDGRIPSGVFKELQTAIDAPIKPKLIIEIPSMICSRGMTYEETKEMLSELGQR